MHNRYAPLQQKQIDRIIELYKIPTPINRIANIMGITRPTITNHLKKAKLYVKAQGPINIYNKYKDINIKDKKDIKEDNKAIQSKGKVISSKTLININRIDDLITLLLDNLDRRFYLDDIKPLETARILEIAINKQVQLKQLDTPQASGDRFIINFINARDFNKDLKEIATSKDKAITVKAVPETPLPPRD